MSTLFYHKRNSVLHTIDASSFFIGVSLCSFGVIIPAYVKSYTNSALLLALIPIIWECGSYIPQLFSLYFTHKRQSHNPVMSYFIFEGIHRLSFIMIGVSILLFGHNITLSLVSFYIFFILSNLSWGLSIPHWIDTLSMTIPDNIFASFIGKRDMVARFIGILSSLALPFILSLAVFPWNYGYLFLIAGVFFTGGSTAIPFLSVLYPMKREPLHKELGFVQYVKQSLKTIIGNTDLRFFLGIFWIMGVSRITNAYMSPYVIDNIIALYPEESRGMLLSWYNTSFLIAMGLSSWYMGEMAHRLKQRYTSIVGIAALSLCNFTLILFPTYVTAIAANLFLATFFNAAYLVTMTAIVDKVKPDGRSVIYAVNNTVTAVFILVFSLIGSGVASLFKYRGALIIPAVLPLFLIFPLIFRKSAKFQD
jgi:MFS family permease